MLRLLVAAFLLQHVTVVDGASRRPDTTVAIEDGRIVAATAPGAKTIDATGQFLIPGLWDMHVHLSFAGEAALLDLVATGVTGVRDMGGDVWQLDAWRREIAAGARIGPTIVQAGPMLDGPKPGLPHRITVETADDGRAAVAVLKRGLQADFVKVHSGVPREAFFAIAAEAKKRGLSLACHLPATVTAAEASASGCASIEHVAESIFQSLRSLEALEGKPGADLFSLLARNGTWVDPTLAAFQRFADNSETAAKKTARDQGLKAFVRAVAAMRRAGVRLLAGSDLAGAFWPVDIHDELGLLVEAGLTPAEALTVATHDAASFLGLQSGIAPGRPADLVLLRADPLADIRHTRSIAAVVVRGRHFTAEELQLLAVGARGH